MNQAAKNENHHFEKDLKQLLEKSKQTNRMTLQEIFNQLAGRGYLLFVILLSLPFCQPLQIPGMSTPFGMVIFFIGLRIAFGHRLWWPKSVLNKSISSHALETIIHKTLWILQKLNKITKVRWTWLFTPKMKFIHGLMIAALGFFLALPLPIPLSNIIAGWALVLLCIGLLEEDGVFVFLSYLISVLCLVAVIVIVFELTKYLIKII